MDEESQKISLRVSRARIRLMVKHSFFGALVYKLGHEERDDVETASTDGIKIYYNRDFISTLNDKQLLGLVAHEVAHCAFEHFARQGERELERWNRACDEAINHILDDCGFYLPEGALLNKKFRNLNAEQIYDMLPKRSSDSSMQWGVVTAPCGCCVKELQRSWRTEVINCVSIQAGKLPKWLERWVDTISKPIIPWQEVMSNFITRHCKDDYSMQHFNKRFICHNNYFPALYSESPGLIVLVIDTSGSIKEKNLSQFEAEVNSLLDTFHSLELLVLYVDCKVHSTERFTHNDTPVKLINHGGGGTNFDPAFNYLAEHQIEPDALVYLTDTFGKCTVSPPPYEVLWVDTQKSGRVFPFGWVTSFADYC